MSTTTDPELWPSPSALLRARAEGHRDSKQPTAKALDTFADDLDAYQRNQGMTWIAIPTEALLALRHVWEAASDDSFRALSLRLVRDAFGGIDGHLLRIDHALTTEQDEEPDDEPEGPCCRAQVTQSDPSDHEPGCYRDTTAGGTR